MSGRGEPRRTPGIRATPSGKWQARYYDPSGRLRGKTFERKADAEAFLAGVRTDIRRGQWVDPSPGRQTLAEFWAEWRPGATNEPSTLALYDQYWRRYVEPALGSVRLGRLTRSTVQRFLEEVAAESGSRWVVRDAHRVLRRILQAAVDDERIARNPAARLRLVPPRRSGFAVLTPQALVRLSEALPDRWRAFVLVMSYGGLRFSEAAGLREDRILWLRRRIRIDWKIVESRGHLHQGPPKTQAGFRTISLPSFVMAALAEHVRLWPPAEKGLVFHDHNGNPIRRNVFYRAWHRATTAAGMPGFRVRNLRHTGASLAVAGGADLHHLKTRMGHASIATTSKFYLELYEGQDREIADRLERLASDPDSERRLTGEEEFEA